jgi:hypothetical protein
MASDVPRTVSSSEDMRGHMSLRPGANPESLLPGKYWSLAYILFQYASVLKAVLQQD